MSEVTNSVRFVLDGQIVEAQGKRRTTTVLDYLREQLHRTGTKEGCAEGDCGACVVLVGELNAACNSVDYIPVNSCIQLLPTLDGKSVKTVESLRKSDGALHPVQQAMVECHGSQCGFCTPGIVMSLAGMVQHNPCPNRQQINDALSGNLCRCTGYKPIVDATLKACEAGPAALKIDDRADVPLLKEIQRAQEPTFSLDGEIVVQPVVRTRKGSEFVSPATLAEVTTYLTRHPGATLLAGSTEIGLQVNKQFSRPAHICYLGNVAELKRVDETAASWRIGAQVPLSAVETLVAQAYPDFAEVLRRFGSPPIRSTATLAGNIQRLAHRRLHALPDGSGRHAGAAPGRAPARSGAGQVLHGPEEERAAAGRVDRGGGLAQAARGAGLPCPQDKQALRAGHFGHLRCAEF